MMSNCWIRSAFPCNNDANKIVTPLEVGENETPGKKPDCFCFCIFSLLWHQVFLTKTAVWNRRTKTPRHLCSCWRYVYCASNLRHIHWSYDLISENLSDKCWQWDLPKVSVMTCLSWSRTVEMKWTMNLLQVKNSLTSLGSHKDTS